jgi:hypothetical protein
MKEGQDRSHLCRFFRGIQEAEQSSQAIAKLQQTGHCSRRRGARWDDAGAGSICGGWGCRDRTGSFDGQGNRWQLSMQALAAQVAQAASRGLVSRLRLAASRRRRGWGRRDRGARDGGRRRRCLQAWLARRRARLRPGQRRLFSRLRLHLGRRPRLGGGGRRSAARRSGGRGRAWLGVAPRAL